MAAALANILSNLNASQNGENGETKKAIPNFRPGDTVRVHARIVEGNKERIQVFEGVVIRRHKGVQRSATFTVRKVSYNVGVERTFLLHSPRVDKIEVVSHGQVRRARLFYLRSTKGKAGRIKSQLVSATEDTAAEIAATNGSSAADSSQANDSQAS